MKIFGRKVPNHIIKKTLELLAQRITELVYKLIDLTQQSLGRMRKV